MIYGAHALGVKGVCWSSPPYGAVMKSAQTDEVQSTDNALFESPPPTHVALSLTNKATATPVFCCVPLLILYRAKS